MVLLGEPDLVADLRPLPDPDLDEPRSPFPPPPLWLPVRLELFSVRESLRESGIGAGKYMLGFLLNLSLSAMPKDDRLGSFRLN